MPTIILLVIILIIYIVLLIVGHKNNNMKINAIVQGVQGILWTLIAVANWADSHIVIKILYVMIIILSFIAGIRGIFQQYFSKS
ncbi:hypothetical protein LI221_11610 [Faecalimonas umbilicata]|nr:hypothetical protein [Faecalimonas umbilicata]